MARNLRFLLLGLATVALWAAVATAAGDAPPSPSELWRRRIAEARDLKLWIASAATALLAQGLVLRLTGHDRLFHRSRDGLLVALALATLFAWWHPYRGSLRAWLHVGDAYHYFIGAKYFDELGYTRLYACSVVADAEAGFERPVAHSQIRNLLTNQLESARLSLRNPGDCKRHFTPERWESFQADLHFFRKRLTLPLWFKLRVDHGYNPPPTWTLLGSLLTAATPVASRTQMLWLTALDPLLIAAMLASIGWGFGWRSLCVAAIYWGTNQPANWEWVGGSIVRFDWLAASAAAIACLRRGHPLAAGLLVAWATGIRVFPGAIAVGVGLGALLRMRRERSLRPEPSELRFGLAFAGGLAVCVVVSAATVGPESWHGFAANSRLHLSTDSVNRTGLRPLLAYSHEDRLAHAIAPQEPDPYVHWRELREARGEQRRPLRYAIATMHLALLLLAVRRQPAWVAGVLGIGAVPVLLELGSYYFGFLLLFACLGSRWPGIDVALVGLSACSWWVGTWGGPDRDVVAAHTSLAMLVFVMGATARVAFRLVRADARGVATGQPASSQLRAWASKSPRKSGTTHRA